MHRSCTQFELVRKRAFFGTLISLAALAIISSGCSSASAHSVATYDYAPYDAKAKDEDVANNEAATSRDPGSAMQYAMLGTAYLARSREVDSVQDAIQAEKATRRSLSFRKLGNYGSADRLVSCLLQQHRFKDALSAAESARELAGNYPPTLMALSESLIEVGRYDEANQILHRFQPSPEIPQWRAIQARMLTIDGKPKEALQLLQKATSEVVEDYHSPRDTVAWFENKLGDAYFALGELNEAELQQRAAVTVYPRCYKALASLTRINASKRDWAGVIKWGQSCEKITQVIDVEALLGDAYHKLGDEKESKQHYAAVAYLAGRPLAASDSLHEYAASPGSHGHTLDRQYAIFCADHGTDLDSAYAFALRDFETRPDLFAFDTLAWVCYKRGDTAEASKAIDLALRRGTKDPRLLYHAAIIKASAHEAKKAKQYIEEASALNMALDPPEQTGLDELELQTKNNEAESTSGSSLGGK